MRKVLVTRHIPGPDLERLKKYFDVDLYKEDKVMPRRELLKRAKNVDALLCLLTDDIDKKFINTCPNLKIISNYAVGFNNIDTKHATKKRIIVTNTPHPKVSESVAEHAVALSLAVAHRVLEGDKFIRTGKYKGWAPEMMIGQALPDRTIGIVGLGRIGSEVAKRLEKGFNMKVIYFDIKRNKEFEKEFSAEYRTMPDLLKESDIITLHVPLNTKTKHLIGSKQIAMMKDTAILINTSRGPVVDEKALVNALKTKKLYGAGLDVYENEPKLAAGLTRLNNVVLTPHTASASKRAREGMTNLAVSAIIDFFRSKTPKNIVNKEVLENLKVH